MPSHVRDLLRRPEHGRRRPGAIRPPGAPAAAGPVDPAPPPIDPRLALRRLRVENGRLRRLVARLRLDRAVLERALLRELDVG
jgi:hypothetical protein